MTTFDELIQDLSGLEAWKLRALCTCSAERVAPLFRGLGKAGHVPRFDTALRELWKAIPDGRIAAVKTALKGMLARDLDDLGESEQFARFALAILLHAVDYTMTKRTKSARNCVEGVASLCDGIDATLSDGPPVRFYDPTNPPPPGELETYELESQAEVLTWLKGATSVHGDWLESLRERARERAAKFLQAARQLAAS